MSAEQNIAVIRSLIDAVNQRNLGVLREFTHPDFQRHDLAGALPETSGAGGSADVVQLLLRAVPDLRLEIKQIIAADDRVVVQLASTGTHQGELLGVPGTGKRCEVNHINIYRLVDGKMAETWQLLDVWGLMRQIGAA